MTDLDKLAKSLTELQMNCVVFWPNGWFPKWTYLALERKGIIGPGMLLTDLGLALRNHLKGQNDG